MILLKKMHALLSINQSESMFLSYVCQLVTYLETLQLKCKHDVENAMMSKTGKISFHTQDGNFWRFTYKLKHSNIRIHWQKLPKAIKTSRKLQKPPIHKSTRQFYFFLFFPQYAIKSHQINFVSNSKKQKHRKQSISI